jgi:hypothetical protein
MKRKHQVSSKPSPRYTYVADHAYEPPPGDEDPENMFPNLLQFLDKGFILINVAKLIWVFVVALKVPIGRRGDYEMDGLIFQEG